MIHSCDIVTNDLLVSLEGRHSFPVLIVNNENVEDSVVEVTFFPRVPEGYCVPVQSQLLLR